MSTYAFTQSVTNGTTPTQPILSPVQSIDEKYITGCELIVDTAVAAGLPVGVQIRHGNAVIWPGQGSGDRWIRTPSGVKVFHKMAFELSDPRKIQVAYINSDSASRYVQVHVIAENHSGEILRLAILAVLKSLAGKLEFLTAPALKNGKTRPEG
jgi:hypothetical protein